MASSNLYPPIVAYSMPAFAIENSTNTRAVGNTKVRIYFALSSYNSRSNFSTVHVTVRYQQNNSNALDRELYPAQIKICKKIYEVEPNNTEEISDAVVIGGTQYRYYIELEDADLAPAKPSDTKGAFQPDTTYKVQLRICADKGPNDKPTIAYFNSVQDQCSEWSTVCLIRGIIPPTYIIKDLEVNDEEVETEMMYASTDAIFTLSYTPGSKEETLRHWRLKLLDTEDNVLADSGLKSFDNYNNILYEDNGSFAIETSLFYQMVLDRQYVLVVTIETKNGYTDTKTLPFITTARGTDELEADVTAYIIEEDGYAVIQVIGHNDKETMNVTLCRTNAESNFQSWEDIANITIIEEKLDWSYCDFTIESGQYYQYGAQIRDIRGRRGPKKTSDKVMGEFEDAFLVEKGESLSNAKQLKLRYDFKVNTLNRVVSESKTDTIGSQYPYVRRNGNMYYRELQCTGLITGFMDNSHLFTTNDKLYHGRDTAARYEEIRDAISMKVNQYDFTYEREFREAVEEFLLNSKVKLFKSLQEGNMLVKLMNVSFTPRQGLNRLLYDFTATFVEVDEVTIFNLNKYGIINVGNYQSVISTINTNLLGRLTDANQISAAMQDTSVIPTMVIPANTDIIELISNKYNVGQLDNDIRTTDFYLTHLRLEIESEPYLINLNTSPPTIVNDKTSKLYNDKGYTVGWLIRLNDQTILLEPPNNIYELKGDDTYLSSNTSVVPLAQTTMQVDFVVNLIKEQDSSRVPIKMTYKKINGQYINRFKSNENIIDTLWYKYYIDFYASNREDEEEDYYEQIIKVFNIEVEAEPGVIVQARSSAFSRDRLSKMVIGETGRLLVDPGSKEYSIEDMYITGRRIDARYLINKVEIAVDEEEKYKAFRDYKDALVDSTQYNKSTLYQFNQLHDYSGQSIPLKPKQYDYYIDSNPIKSKMFYNGQWYPMTCDKINGINTIFDIDCPVEAMLFYFVQAEKGYYG